ncbi:glycosyltransferase family 4 protein [Curtobacterium sp. MCLR17_034]|uniref:glycosyltransferase family 4 protein n=1 Tax=Curtobacterium sp. MCLR17_034 TaxID=2175623 RepID=UPI000DA9A6FF|nr:glycosyltransferase family 4 protein [Curtobacterium sp. MCLR17_034]PZF13068.1 glycosyltransferase WbuB [Curtobacterium sp. MCLR17_034]
MKPPPSVLLVGLNYSPESTGIAPYSAGLARELAARGWRVRVITSFPHYPQWAFRGGRPRRAEESVEDEVRVVRRRHELPRKPGGVARALSELSFGFASLTAASGRPDVVVLVSPALISSALALVKAKVITRRPVVVWVQDLYTLGVKELGDKRSHLSGRAIAAVERWVLRSSDRVVVIHERFRDTVMQEFGLQRDAVAVVRNWSHLADVAPLDRHEARVALGWDPEHFVVLHAGNMGLKQGLENVVEAARLASARSSAVRFVLLGDGNQREHLAKLAADVPALSIIGSLPDDQFRQALVAADALLVNEKGGVEGMAVPSKLTSYFSTGLPVIAATDRGSITESELRMAEAGPVVKADDPRALLDAADSLRADPDLAAKMGENGRRFRSTQLDPRVSFDRFAQLLSALAAGQQASASSESGND